MRSGPLEANLVCMFGNDWLDRAFSGTTPASRVVAEKRIVEASDREVPEHRVSAALRTEFDADGPSVQLVVNWACSGQLSFLDSAQVEATIRLLQEALPQLREMEEAVEPAWVRWRGVETDPVA